MLGLVRPVVGEHLHVGNSRHLERLVHRCCQLVAAHVAVAVHHQERFDDAVLNRVAVRRRVVDESHGELVLNGISELAENHVLRFSSQERCPRFVML